MSAWPGAVGRQQEVLSQNGGLPSDLQKGFCFSTPLAPPAPPLLNSLQSAEFMG